MTTECSQSKQPQKPMNPSQTDMSEKVNDSEKGSEIIDKTGNTSMKEVDMTKKASMDASDAVLEKKDSTPIESVKMTKKEKVNVSVIQSRFFESSCQVGSYIRTRFPALGKFYDDKIKSNVDSLVKNYQRFPISYEKHIKPNLGRMRIIHSVCLILWGGSWYSFAVLLSFFHVYAVEDYTRGLMLFPFDGAVVDAEMWETLIVESAYELWVLFVIFYVVWTVPFFTSMTFVLTIYKCVTKTNVSRAMIEYLEQQRLYEIFGKWLGFAVVGASVLLFILLPLRIQACLLMSCLGHQKMSEHSREMVESIKWPNNYDGMILIFCTCIAASIIFQYFSGFQASVFGFTVPLGFCIPKVNKLMAQKQE